MMKGRKTRKEKAGNAKMNQKNSFNKKNKTKLRFIQRCCAFIRGKRRIT